MKLVKIRAVAGESVKLRNSLLLVPSIYALAWASPGLAQSVPAADEPAISNDIIVTAQRRNERLEDVPMTVSVITQETLASSGVSSLRDIQNVTTGFQLGQGGGFPQPAIRGVTTVLNGTFENNIAVYVDGFYQVAAQAIGIDLPNIESIQVLKGPQGTLYGRNATGGALLLNTITPGDFWRGKAELTYGRFDDKRASAYVAGPLSDMIGVSIAGYVRRTDSYNRFASRTVPGARTDEPAAPIEQDSVRAKLRVGLGEDFTATLGYAYTHTKDGRGLLFTPYENIHPGYLQRPGGNLLPRELGVVAYDWGAFVDTQQHDFTLTMEWDTGIGTLKSLTGYSIFRPRTEFDFDGSYITQQTPITGNPVTGSFSTSNFKQKTFQQALDFAVTAIDNVDLIVGATFFHDVFDTPRGGGSTAYTITPGLDPSVPPPRSALTPNLERFIFGDKAAWAVYGDLSWHLTDRLTVNVGGRYSQEHQDAGARFETRPAGAVTLDARASANFSKFTPRASIRYEVADRTNIYASFSQGFRSGAFPTFPPGNPPDPSRWIAARQEVVNAYELGIKTAGSNFRAELAGFYYDYKDLQVSTTQLVSGPTGTLPLVVITNVPKATIYGVEGSFEFEPTENFTIRGGATWLHARYGDGALVDGTGINSNTLGITTYADPLRNYVNQTQAGQNLTGLQLPRAPDFTAFLGADYLIPMGEGGLRFAANVKYTSSYVVTNPSVWCDANPLPGQTASAAIVAIQTACAANVPADRRRQQRFRESGYALVNASVTWTDPTDHYYVRVWGNNLTNHKYRLHYTGTASGTYSPMAEPLTFGVTVGAKFGDRPRVVEAAPPPAPVPYEEAAPPPPPPPAPPPPPPPPPPAPGERG